MLIKACLSIHRRHKVHLKRQHLVTSLHWRHNGLDSVSNHQPHDCLLNRLFGRRSKKTSKLRVTGLCAGTSPGTGEFPAQMTSYAENVLFDDGIMFCYKIVATCGKLQLGETRRYFQFPWLLFKSGWADLCAIQMASVLGTAHEKHQNDPEGILNLKIKIFVIARF